MTRDEFLCLPTNGKLTFWTYYGESYRGFMVDYDQDPFYYIVHNQSRWNSLNQSTKESDLEMVGTKVNRECILRWYRYDRGNINQGPSIVSIPVNLSPKKMIIFGAGASFDFNFNDPDKNDIWVPPLGNHLFEPRFNDIMSLFPGVQSRLSSLRLQGGIENYFQQEWDDITKYYSLNRLKDLINIQYYLFELLHRISINNNNYESNNYDILAGKMYDYIRSKQEPIFAVNFNYDTLFESSIKRQFKFTYSSMDDYIDSRRCLYYFKPHGSCNWVKYMDKGEETNHYDFSDIVHSADFVFNRNYDLMTINLDMGMANAEIEVWDRSYKRGKIPYPALLVPLRDKDDFVMPDIHKTYFENGLHFVRDILIIGWKGSEDKFLSLLKEELINSINLTIVDKYADDVEDILVQKAGLNVGEVLKVSTFTEFITSDKVSRFFV